MVFGLIFGIFFWLCVGLFWWVTSNLAAGIVLSAILLWIILEILVRSVK